MRDGVIAGSVLVELLATDAPATEARLEAYHTRWLTELGNAMWSLYEVKTSIFREKEREVQDERLFKTLAGYFHPDSEYRKV
jgi:digeranylgeranylglycerophospholipid reductase